MAHPEVGHLVRWQLEDHEKHNADMLLPDQLKKMQTINAELAEGIAQFPFEVGADSGKFLNTPDFWMLRGRRSLVLELLQAHDDAMQAVEAAAGFINQDTGNGN